MVVAAADVLVERGAELAVVDDLLRRTVAGSGAVLVVEGEAGIGKTALIRAVTETGSARGLRVAVGAGRPFESTRAFGPLVEALHLRRGSADPRRSGLGRLLDGASDSGAPIGASAEMRHRLIDEIVDLVEVLARDGPSVVVLEDLHWADDGTIVAFRALAAGLRHVPVFLVGTVRPTPRSMVLAQVLDDLDGARRLRLRPLSNAAVHAVVRAELGSPAGPALARVVDRAGGNPLWIVEILRALAAEGLIERTSSGADVLTAGLPDTFRQLVLRKLRFLPDRTLNVLRTAAVLGDEFSVIDLATVTGSRALHVLSDLAPALAAGLLRENGASLVFRHQLVHDAIHEAIPEPARAALHRDVARVLAAAGAPLGQVAAHLLRGVRPGDREAVDLLRAAASEALSRAPELAVELLRRADELAAYDRPLRDAVAAELVDALLRAGRVTDAADRAEAALDGPHGQSVDLGLRLALVSALSLQNRGPELVVQAAAVLRVADELGAPDQALVLAQAAYGHTLSGDLRAGERAARQALATARDAGDPTTTVWSLTTLSFAVKTQGRYVEAVELARDAVRIADAAHDEQGHLRHPHFFLGMALTDADDVAEGRKAYRRAVRACAELGSTWILPDVQQLSGELHLLVGEWDDAQAELEAGLAAAAQRGNRVPVAQSHGYLALIAAARGDRAAARAALAAVRPELNGPSPAYGSEVPARVVALLEESAGRPERALAVLHRAWGVSVERGARRSHRDLAPPLARLAVAAARPDVAAEVVDAVAAAAAEAAGVPGLRAAVLRCQGIVDRDPEPLLAAAALTRTGPRVLEHADTCADAAAALTTAGRGAEAVLLWCEALDQYERVSAFAWAAAARAALRGLGVRQGVRGPRRRPTTGWASLTDTERAVALLVAEGLTNREVGRRLFVSPHTVNTHLRHIFGKLGISSRAGLSALVVRHTPRQA